MQITQTTAAGLKREFKVVLAAADLLARMEGELASVGQRAKIPGFRPGKVPKEHLRRMYGKSVMSDVVNNAVTESNRRIVEENGLKLAMEPNVQFPQEREKIDAAMDAKGDLEYTISLEVLPTIDVTDHSDITLEKQVVEVGDAEIDAAITRMAEPMRPFADKGEKAVAASGDRVSVDFVGRVNGVEFDGGKGEGIQVVIGSNTFIPGFEDQLIGFKVGDTKLVEVTFPPNYAAAQLAGQPAEFDVTAKVIEAPGELVIDEALAKQYGMEDLAKLKDAVKSSIASEYTGAARRKMKRQLLDALDAKYSFDLPPTLLEQEFNAIWNNVGMEMKAAGKSFEDEGTTEEAAKADYQKIASRRVRLGLLLAEVGEKAGVQVTDDEVSQGLVQRARQFPGQEKEVWEYYRKNPQALAEVRAPIFEEKVVDHLLAQVKVTEKSVTKEALMAEDGEDAPAAEAAEKPKKAAAKKAKKTEE